MLTGHIVNLLHGIAEKLGLQNDKNVAVYYHALLSAIESDEQIIANPYPEGTKVNVVPLGTEYAQQSVHPTAFGVGLLAFLAGFGICWLVFVR